MRLIPRLPRRAVLPAELAAALELGSGAHLQKVLAWSVLVGGGAAVATVGDLRILTPRGKQIIRPWMDVDRAVWEQDSRMLVVWWVDSGRTTPLEIQDDVGDLPVVIRERVQSSVVLTSTVVLPGGRSGRVALRRAADGTITGQSLLPPRVSEADPQVAAALRAALAALWSEAGETPLNQSPPPPL